MDRKIFLDNLSRLLERIGIHPDVIVEIVAELKHSGNEAGFVSVLEARLKFLNEHVNLQGFQGFESLLLRHKKSL